MVSATEPDVPLGRATLSHLGRSIRSFATSDVVTRAAAFAALLLVLRLAINGRNVLNSHVAPDYMSAIDQRIADDVRSLTTNTLSPPLMFLNGTPTVVAFPGVLGSIGPSPSGVAAGYALVGSVVAVVLGWPPVRLNYDQSDREADFRDDLVHVRANVVLGNGRLAPGLFDTVVDIAPDGTWARTPTESAA